MAGDLIASKALKDRKETVRDDALEIPALKALKGKLGYGIYRPM